MHYVICQAYEPGRELYDAGKTIDVVVDANSDKRLYFGCSYLIPRISPPTASGRQHGGKLPKQGGAGATLFWVLNHTFHKHEVTGKRSAQQHGLDTSLQSERA